MRGRVTALSRKAQGSLRGTSGFILGKRSTIVYKVGVAFLTHSKVQTFLQFRITPPTGFTTESRLFERLHSDEIRNEFRPDVAKELYP
jgi:hypothetical protein